MKKLVLLIASVLFAMITMAQSVDNATGINVKMDVNTNKTYFRDLGNALDTIGIVDSTWSTTFSVDNLYDALKQQVRLKVDEVTGTGRFTAYWKGKNFLSNSWTNISTINYYGTGSDTTILIDQSTAKTYRFYQLEVDVVATTAQTLKMLDFEVYWYK